jgi:hypothetical protein
MYATQKLNNPNLSRLRFQNQLTNYLRIETDLQNNFLNGVLTGLRQPPPIGLPDQQQLPERVINSISTGEQGKAEIYEVFKALNDKWIAGGDYKTKTLFEDFLFLDRASRNIGDTILIDIFDLKNMLNKKSLNQAMSVFTFISGILIKNNFTVMPLPAYVNFYNVQDVDGTTTPKREGSLEFANNLWGTFLDVDYRNSSPKLVCFYVGKPSQYLDLPKGNFKFRDDGFDLRRASESPLIEDQQGKTDWALSNKCVGFNVDVGLRNQNIFYSFTVSQDNGLATSEAINTYLNMVDQSTGRAIATQNVSLYNLYKQRSYKASVVCLGNALLQPTMYFNLRHVPMFNGPYMITDVSHSIQPGTFQTTFEGVRQGIYDLPAIDSFLQSINQNLISQLEELLLINKDQAPSAATTDNIKSTEVVQEAENTLDTTNSCTDKITADVYKLAIPAYTPVTSEMSGYTPTEFAQALQRIIPNDVDLQVIIYCISYIKTFQENSSTKLGNFYAVKNNLANISLSFNWGESVSQFSTDRFYTCVNITTNPSKTLSEPIAHFESLDSYIKFMEGRLKENKERVIRLGLAKYYVCFWPASNISEEYYNSNFSEFQRTRDTFTESLASAVQVGLISKSNSIRLDKINKERLEAIANSPSVTPTPSPIPPNFGQKCPPPEISTFFPSAGFKGAIVQVNGRNFESVESITVIDKVIDISQIRVFNPQTLRFSLPEITIPDGQSVATGRIIVKTANGEDDSSVDFTYNPALENVNVSSPGGLANTSTQQQTTVAQQDLIGSNLNPQDTGFLPLTVFQQQRDALGNTLKLDVVINPKVGGWKISETNIYSYTIQKLIVGPNNVPKKEQIKSESNLKLENFVSEDQQIFSIDKDQMTTLLNLNQFSSESIRAVVNITVLAIPDDRTKNPKDFPSNYIFELNVPQKSPSGIGQIILVSNTNSGELPAYDGNSYYNIIKPNGGYYTFQLTPITNLTATQIRIVKLPTLSQVNASTENTPNTRYTNVVTVRELGEFQMVLTYTDANLPNSSFTVTSEKFTL